MITQLLGTKFERWGYEEEVRVYAELEQFDEETGQYSVDFHDSLVLKEVIAGVGFPMSSWSIESALQGYPGCIRIIRAGLSETSFEIIVDKRGNW